MHLRHYWPPMPRPPEQITREVSDAPIVGNSFGGHTRLLELASHGSRPRLIISILRAPPATSATRKCRRAQATNADCHQGSLLLGVGQSQPHPVDLHPEEEDRDPQDQFEPVTGQVIGTWKESEDEYESRMARLCGKKQTLASTGTSCSAYAPIADSASTIAA